MSKQHLLSIYEPTRLQETEQNRSKWINLITIALFIEQRPPLMANSKHASTGAVSNNEQDVGALSTKEQGKMSSWEIFVTILAVYMEK